MSTAADGPIVGCRAAAAYAGDKNVRLTCEVQARPGLTALFWVIDVNGTAVTEGMVIDEYWSLNMVRSQRRRVVAHGFSTERIPQTGNFRISEGGIGTTYRQHQTVGTLISKIDVTPAILSRNFIAQQRNCSVQLRMLHTATNRINEPNKRGFL